MTEEKPMTVLAAEADDKDPLKALQAAAALQKQIARAEDVAVRRARTQGCSWEQIATVLGVSRQAVHRKYGGSRFSRD